jgi:hypothetical protein
MNGQSNKTAADEVAFWRGLVQKIQADIGIAEATVSGSEARRTKHTLAAAMADDDAKKHLATVLEDDPRAERELRDLKLALPQAEAELANAERALKAAEAEHRRAEVERIALLRVEAAAAIDRAFADFNKAWATFSDLGSELIGLASQDPGANALYLAETVSGEARLVASLPRNPFLAVKEKFPFMAVSTQNSVADSERNYWRLPPVDEVKAA